VLAPDPISDAVLDNWSRVARIALVGFVFLTVLVRKFFGIDFT